MSRRDGQSVRGRCRFPRVSGDEPLTVFRYLDDNGFSPRERG